MSGTSIVTLIIILIVLVLAYFWYASLIRRRNRALEALSSIDVQLRKRHDLLPSVLKLANQFMTHERSLITELTELRAEVQKPYTPTDPDAVKRHLDAEAALQDRKSTRLNSSHVAISYAVFCLREKKCWKNGV